MSSVSVVIPTLNEASYLPLLLSDLAFQSIEPTEIIVVDGGSQDDTVSRAASLGARIITSPKGVAIQRSLGCLAAKSEYILLLDADTRLEADVIKTWIHLAKDREYEISIPSYMSITTNPITLSLFQVLNHVFRVSASTLPSGAGCGILIHRSVLKERLFDPRTSFDDIEFIRRMGKKYQFGVVREAVVKVSDRRFREEGAWVVAGKYLLLSVLFCFNAFIFSSLITYRFGAHEPQSTAS